MRESISKGRGLSLELWLSKAIKKQHFKKRFLPEMSFAKLITRIIKGWQNIIPLSLTSKAKEIGILKAYSVETQTHAPINIFPRLKMAEAICRKWYNKLDYTIIVRHFVTVIMKKNDPLEWDLEEQTVASQFTQSIMIIREKEWSSSQNPPRLNKRTATTLDGLY